MKRTVYLDNNATTPIAEEVLEVMLPYLKDLYFNPSSSYDQARQVRDAVEEARAKVAKLIGACSPNEVIFTASGTEGNNAAIRGALRANPDRRHVITTAVEHPAVLEVVKEVGREGFRVTFLPVDHDGKLNVRDLVRALDEDTAIVSIMHANNETGVIFPIENLSRIVKETDPNIIFHTDATQSVGKLPIDLTSSLRYVDILTFSGHKIHAPKGIGAMFVRRGTKWRPFMLGGHQERGRRAGTENVPYIVGLGKACDLAREHLGEEERLRRLQIKLEKEILERIPHVLINGAGAPRLPNTTNFAFEYIEGEGILFALNQRGICASSGSACTSGSLEPSHVLKAMNVPFTAAHGSLRISMSRYTTEEDIDYLIEVLPEVVASLRSFSPYWDKERNRPKEGVPVFVQPKYQQ